MQRGWPTESWGESGMGGLEASRREKISALWWVRWKREVRHGCDFLAVASTNSDIRPSH